MHVWESLNIFVLVLVQVYVCVSGFLFACAYQKVVLTQSSAARPPSGSGSPSPRSSSDTGTHNAVDALLHAAPNACYVFVVCCSVGVPVAHVGMYVCMVLRVMRAVVCCSVAIIPTHS